MDYFNNSKNKTYKFITPSRSDDTEFKPLKPIKFYQISSYMLPTNNTHEVRINYINEFNEFVNYKTILIDKKVYKKILKQYPQNIYKLYSGYDLDNVGLPTINDIMIARSYNAN